MVYNSWDMGYKTLAIFSNKGGTGKTTCTWELAKALKRKRHEVGILDSDFSGPNIQILAGCEGVRLQRTTGDVILPVTSHEGIKILSWGMIWPQDSAVLVEDRQIEPEDLHHAIALLKSGREEAAIKFLTWLAENPGGAMEYTRLILADGAIDWGSTEYLLVDTSPSTRGYMKAIVDCGLWGAILICQPSRVAIADVRRTVDLMRSRQVPVVGLISNQGTWNGILRYDLRDQDLIGMAAQWGVPFISAIPHTDDLGPHYDEVAEFVLKSVPVILEKREPREEEWQKSVRELHSMARLLEALR